MSDPKIGAAFLEDAVLQLRKYKGLADKALAQVADADLFRTLDPESNSIAVILKHVSGNMRSRWTDFLTTDGEKADRDRDGEFELGAGDTKASVLERWETGWTLLFDTIAKLSPEYLTRTVGIRGEPHTVLQAIDRQLVHYVYHVGQIVFLARHFAGARWTSLSIPKGKSREFDVSKDGRPYALRSDPPMMKLSIALLALALSAVCAALPLTAAEPPLTLSHAGCAAPGEPVDPLLLERPTTLKSDIGQVHQKVTTASADAQAFHDQGLTDLHHYVFIEAARSFRQALRSDPGCAMCWMGLARAEQGLERPDATAAAITKAKELAPKASPREQTFIDLRAQQIEAQAAAPSEEKEKHAAYKAALDAALAVSPDDAELWILRGNAEEPGPWGRGQFGGAPSIAFYETALVRSPGHLGARHYLVHSFENIGHHAEAAAHGEIYAGASPGVAHAQHMYGHVLPRLNRWQEALAQFEKADAIEEAYAKTEHLRPGDDWHHLHNLQLLGYTYLRLGRAADAEKTFRRAFDTPARLPYRGWPQASLAELALLSGRPEEALTIARALQRPTRTISAHVAGAVVEGEALLALGRANEAKGAAARAHELLDQGRAELGAQARYLELFGRPFVDQLETEIALRGADPTSAEASIRRVAEELSRNPRFDAWGEGLFRLERIAAEARRAGRTGLADEITAKMKRIDPDYVPGSAVSVRAASR